MATSVDAITLQTISMDREEGDICDDLNNEQMEREENEESNKLKITSWIQKLVEYKRLNTLKAKFTKRKKKLLCYIAFAGIIIANITIMAMALSTVSSVQQKSIRYNDDVLGAPDPSYQYHVDTEHRPFQDCYGKHLKQSFPDLDYALLGYNILRGYPLETRHDPGFTLPIFKADYGNLRFSADCRFSVPQGLSIAPDVSCITSFTSETIRNSFELSKLLQLSAKINAGGPKWFGASFSASVGYKQSAATVSSGNSLFVLSTAKCLYYYSYLHPVSPPPLDDDFVKQAALLSESDDEDVYMDFFDNYGTHFAKEVTFGAKYIFKHKMSSEQFKTASSKQWSVNVQASYAGMFSVGGGFGMSLEQREMAQSFSQSVETTTISIGAPPPANGDALTWASTVKDSPVPMEYTLVSIAELFETDRFFKGNKDINSAFIYGNINKFKYQYCLRLLDQGEVDSCEALTPGLKLEGMGIYPAELIPDLTQSTVTQNMSSNTCIQLCLQNYACVASEYNVSQNLCTTMYHPLKFEAMFSLKINDHLVSYIYPSKSHISAFDIMFFDASISSNIYPRQVVGGHGTHHCSEQACREACYKDVVCVCFIFCYECSEVFKCKLYTEKSIARSARLPIEIKTNHITVFISRNDEFHNKKTIPRC